MRKLNLGTPPPRNTPEWDNWIEQALHTIEQASFEETEEVADDFELSNVTTTRTLDPTTVTLQGLANAFGTFLQSLKSRGDRIS